MTAQPLRIDERNRVEKPLLDQAESTMRTTLNIDSTYSWP